MSDEHDQRPEPGERGAQREGGPRGPAGPGLRGRIARRIFGDAEAPDLTPEERKLRSEAREVLGAMLETGDRARTEVYRLVAREVRSYLEALQVADTLHHLVTHYSLEVNASVSLKPLADKLGKAGAAAERPNESEPEPTADEDDEA